ncbi:MAG: polysaccharide deacetylase family protein [Candidatus Azobacteroides sp.]|nr:polysaccharide deacetylase family protein [Candidatus Azobacteroides sp.]
MMTIFLKQHILAPLTSLIGLKQLINSTKEQVVNVFYHTVSDEYLPHISPLYRFKNAKEFEQDLNFLLKHFQPITIDDVLFHSQNKKRIEKPAFHLSFDDGLREIYDVVMPILRQKGVPATVFINSNFVDNRDLFFRYKAALIADKNKSIKSDVLKIKYPGRKYLDDLAQTLNIDFCDFLQKQQPYLSTEQLQTLQKNGFTIGAHSESHPNYNLISEKEQIEQTVNSCAFVKQNFAIKKSFFAFPFGAEGISNSFFEKIYNDVDLTFGISGINTTHNGKHIDRIDMETYGKNAQECIYRAYMTNFLKNAFNKNKTQRA